MHWFHRTQWWYKPTHILGWGITLLCLAFCVHVIVFFDSQVRSVSDLFYVVFPYILPTLLLLDRIAAYTSSPINHDAQS